MTRRISRGLEIAERKFTMIEVEALEEGRLVEAFAVGTAVCSTCF